MQKLIEKKFSIPENFVKRMKYFPETNWNDYIIKKLEKCLEELEHDERIIDYEMDGMDDFDDDVLNELDEPMVEINGVSKTISLGAQEQAFEHQKQLENIYGTMTEIKFSIPENLAKRMNKTNPSITTDMEFNCAELEWNEFIIITLENFLELVEKTEIEKEKEKKLSVLETRVEKLETGEKEKENEVKLSNSKLEVIEKFIKEIKKIVREDIENFIDDSKGRLTVELINDLIISITNKIHDKLYDYF